MKINAQLEALKYVNPLHTTVYETAKKKHRTKNKIKCLLGLSGHPFRLFA